MRVPKSWIPIIAGKVVDTLLRKDLVKTEATPQELKAACEEIVLDELMVEDRINEEVREILKGHEKDIESKRLDYKKLFDMTKQKLVRERNIIL